MSEQISWYGPFLIKKSIILAIFKMIDHCLKAKLPYGEMELIPPKFQLPVKIVVRRSSYDSTVLSSQCFTMKFSYILQQILTKIKTTNKCMTKVS